MNELILYEIPFHDNFRIDKQMITSSKLLSKMVKTEENKDMKYLSSTTIERVGLYRLSN